MEGENIIKRGIKITNHLLLTVSIVITREFVRMQLIYATHSR